MTPFAWLYLLRREIGQRPGAVLVLVFCTAFSCLVAALAFHVLLYMHRDVRPFLAEMFPPQRLVVRPGEANVLFFNMQTGKLTNDVADRILATPGVTNVSGQMSAEFPAMAEVMLGAGDDVAFVSDAVLYGVPRDLVADGLPPGASFDWAPGDAGPVPVVASLFFLELYNVGLAEGAGLPRFSKSAIIGREFDLVLGESSVGIGGTARPERVRARIVGLTADPSLVGLSLPLDLMGVWNGRQKVNWQPRYQALHVDASSPEDAERLRDAWRKEGWRVEWAGENLARAQSVAGGIELLVAGAAAAIALLALVAIGSTVSMAGRERRAAWGLQRATGMTPLQLAGLVIGEHVLLAAVGGGIAAGIVALLAVVARDRLAEALAQTAAVPGDPLAVAPMVYVATFAFALVVLLPPMLVQLVPTVRRSPVSMLAERSV